MKDLHIKYDSLALIRQVDSAQFLILQNFRDIKLYEKQMHSGKYNILLLANINHVALKICIMHLFSSVPHTNK